MARCYYDYDELIEPDLLIPGKKPVGPVERSMAFPSFKRIIVPQNNVRRSEIVARNPLSVSGQTLLTNENGNRACHSNGYVRDLSIGNVTLPFTLGCRFKLKTDASPAGKRLMHLTKDSGLTSISGIQLVSTGMIAQHYNGSNYVTTKINITLDDWYTAWVIFTTGNILLDVNGSTQSTSMTYSGSPNRFCIGNADWASGEESDIYWEWIVYCGSALSEATRRKLDEDSYQFLQAV